ncbi:MAG: hypothetical protein MI810_21575 [Flavobacteriales bacterium]|nr:hypothetical protein [Flavobacteriales bacterium]
MVLLSITGLFRTVLIILGVIVLLRSIGKLMIAKRNVDEQERMNRELNAQRRSMEESRKNFGKTTVSKISKADQQGDFVEFEEVED